METIDISESIVKPSPKKRVTKKTEPDSVDQPTPARKRATKKTPATTPEPEQTTPEPEPTTPEPEPTTPEVESVAPEPVPVKEEPLQAKKPKGHRPKKEDKDNLLEKVQCEKCDKQISLHAMKYTHKKNCQGSALGNPSAETEPSSSSRDEPNPIRHSPRTIPNPTFTKPTSMRDQILQKKMMIASKLIAQAF